MKLEWMRNLNKMSSSLPLSEWIANQNVGWNPIDTNMGMSSACKVTIWFDLIWLNAPYFLPPQLLRLPKAPFWVGEAFWSLGIMWEGTFNITRELLVVPIPLTAIWQWFPDVQSSSLASIRLPKVYPGQRYPQNMKVGVGTFSSIQEQWHHPRCLIMPTGVEPLR